MTTEIISNDVIKGAIISYLKSLTTLTDKLDEYGTGAVEIRESQWKSDVFHYPNVRVRMIRNLPDFGNCIKSSISFSVMVFTEDQTSAMCDELSGIIATYLQTTQFGVSFLSNTYNFGLGGVTLIPAVSVGELTWRSEVLTTGFVSKE